MHKENFIDNVSIEIKEEIIDIVLLDKNGIIIEKRLSQGEQQLYATALLKALVDESEFNSPFYYSPLEKFDKRHSKYYCSSIHQFQNK